MLHDHFPAITASWMTRRGGRWWKGGDMRKRNTDNGKPEATTAATLLSWEKGCSTNCVPYPMGTSCDTHGTAAESCWWHIPFHWTPPCWHEWLCVAMPGFFYHTRNMCSYTFVAALLPHFPQWLNLKSTQLILHPPLVWWWCCYWNLSIDCLVEWTQ